MQLQRLYSSNRELAPRDFRARVTLGGREKKIEHYIPSSTNSLPGSAFNKKESRENDALAACCRNVLHGVRGHLWDGSDHLWGRLWARNSGFAVSTGLVVLANGVHDW